MYPTQRDVRLEELIRAFRADHPAEIERAVFGVAGMVRDGRCVEATNLPWTVDAATIADAAGLEHALLVNDVEACAHGIASLEPGDVSTLNAGAAGATGNAVLLAAGTGLGQAGLFWDGERHHVFSTEGGYVDFAPRNAFEEGLRRELAERHGTVSYERVCSGEGLTNIHRYVTGEELQPPEIVRRAHGGDEPAERSVQALVSILGAAAGTAALSLQATGGVYLAGGITQRVLPWLESGGFVDAFLDKGIVRSLLERIPVRVILDERAGLIGAARLALTG
ncbi:MAG: glucokinase [Gaiellaceae bacterium]|nr:glucokinase [Gaiellaceae bacterium]